ncbi:MAG TPA: integrase arm-type DNA-binding domain-containing protein, partial [Rhodanobacteraceae bacterium]|nr:integrase arm-type DNA-binding domain-containing protein [Rhodanobacteraceae bacterium]
MASSKKPHHDWAAYGARGAAHGVKGGAPKGRRELRKLAALTINKLPKGRHADGGGLWLSVRNGGRSWVFVYSKGAGASRTRHEVGLGSVHAVDLKIARMRAENMRASLAAGNDPLSQKKAHERAEAARRARQKTFGDCALLCIAARRSGWSNTKHAKQWEATLREYAKPIWTMPVNEVDRAAVLRCIQPIWTEKTETASRVLDRIKAVLDWAAFGNLRSGDNPARWKGALDQVLPKPGKVKKVKHHPALDYRDVHAFVRNLRARSGNAARSLELQIFAACRPGEAARAEWSEFDLEAKVWTIPASRTKTKKEHRVPLNAAVVKMLRALPTFEKHALLFPGPTGKKAITTDARMKIVDAIKLGLSAHGFRSTFRDWAGDETHYARDVIEAAYGHAIKNAAEAAYRRADALAKRRELMDAWAK